MKNSIEYLISKHWLKILLANKMITQEEFDRINELNKKTFLK